MVRGLRELRPEESQFCVTGDGRQGDCRRCARIIVTLDGSGVQAFNRDWT